MNYRNATASDGGVIWELVKKAGTLELNTPYCYMLMAQLYGRTTILAEDGERVVGFVMGLTTPERPRSVFVWQVGVDPDYRGRGLASRLLNELMERSQAIYLEASVTPSNRASMALFRGMARRWCVGCEESTFFSSDQFPEPHEEERLLSIGPVFSVLTLGGKKL